MPVSFIIQIFSSTPSLVGIIGLLGSNSVLNCMDCIVLFAMFRVCEFWILDCFLLSLYYSFRLLFLGGATWFWCVLVCVLCLGVCLVLLF